MSWIGAGIGAFLGTQRGGILGGIVGAVVGSWLEEKAKAIAGGEARKAKSTASADELSTLAALAAMLSKLAKADGRISENEVRYCERLFDRLGLHGEKREYCIRVFRAAKNDSHSIYEYAESFAAAQQSGNFREVVYDILWDLACADGTVSAEELHVLQSITGSLRIGANLFAWECRRHGVANPSEEDRYRDDPYSVLGCEKTASDDEVKSAYRKKARELHPDVLRAQGLSEELLSRANSQMARVNAAWAEIKKMRGL